MIHKMGYDCQCEQCGRACDFDEVDENGDCELCQQAYFEQQARYWRPLYEGEKRAGLLQTEEDLAALKTHGGLFDQEAWK